MLGHQVLCLKVGTHGRNVILIIVSTIILLVNNTLKTTLLK